MGKKWKFFCLTFCFHNFFILLQFELPEDAKTRVKKVSVLRNLCQKVSRLELLHHCAYHVSFSCDFTRL